MESISLPRTYADALIEIAKKHAPAESCALLIGRHKNAGVLVSDIMLTENIDSEPKVRFSVAPDELIECYKAAQNSGDEVVGIFHSHPSSEPKPSETDIKYMTTNPVVWVIHSVRDNIIRAYIIDDESGLSKEIVLNLTS